MYWLLESNRCVAIYDVGYCKRRRTHFARDDEDTQSIAMGDSILAEGDILTLFSLQRVSDDVIEKLVG